MSGSDDWGVPGSGVEIYQSVFVPAMMDQWAAKVIALAAPQAGERVLDVACGTGVQTGPLAEAVGPTGRVVGLDFSPKMLAIARTIEIDPSRMARIEWHEGDVMALPFEPVSFDIVLC